jgi:glycosyltransferase involved in cell wall biosynthesis
MDPKVTVVTTLFNYANYIGESINAFLTQDFNESEMVIVDDGSTDNWRGEILRHATGHFDRIRVVSLSINCGYSTAKNVGIYFARSPILVMLDIDDMIMKDGISSRYKVMQSKDYDMVHAPALKLGKHGEISDDFYPASQRAKAYRKTDGHRFIHAQGVMIKKSAHNKVGMYDEQMRCSSDKEMWARCLGRLHIGFSYSPCALYRIHPNQMHKSSWKMKNLDRINKDTNKRISRRTKSLQDVCMLSDYKPADRATEIYF